MGLSDHRRQWIILYHRLDCIVSSAGLYCIVGWIVSYRLDWIVSYQLDQETLDFMGWLVTVWMGRMGHMDWMGRCWDEGGTYRR